MTNDFALDPAAPPLTSEATLVVVDALYAFAEDPSKISNVFHAIEGLNAQTVSADERTVNHILAHAERASKLAGRLHAASRNPGDAHSIDALFLSADGRIVSLQGDCQDRLEPFLDGPLKQGQRPRFSETFSPMFEDALRASRQKKSQLLSPMLFARAETGERCVLFIASRDMLKAGSFAPDSDFQIALVLALHQGPTCAADALKQSLHLTNSEWRIAERLSKGIPLIDVASELGISILTARSTLKSIFAKLQVHKQGEVAQILNQAALIAPAPQPAPLGVRDPGRQYLRLPDDRTLAFRDYGPDDGLPCIFFHTTLHASLLQEEAVTPCLNAGVRLIAFDRPGFGHSSPTNDYSFSSVSHDVRRLLDQLKLDKVVFSGSGVGGAFALAAAQHLPERTICVTLSEPRLSKMKPEAGTGFFHRAHTYALQHRWFHRAMGELFHRGRHRVMTMMYLNQSDKGVKETDRRRADPKFVESQVARSLDAFEKSGRGLADELTLLSVSDGVSPNGVECPIGVWHGRMNDWVPVEESIRHFQHHPYADLFILEDVGTFQPASVYADMIAWTFRQCELRGIPLSRRRKRNASHLTISPQV